MSGFITFYTVSKWAFFYNPSRRCNLQATKAVEALIKARVNPNYISKKIATPPIILAVEKVRNLKVKPLLLFTYFHATFMFYLLGKCKYFGTVNKPQTNSAGRNG